MEGRAAEEAEELAYITRMSTAVSLPALAEVLCVYCESTFFAASTWESKFCSSEHRRAHRAKLRRVRRQSVPPCPDEILAARARNQRWCEEHRNSINRNPWLAGPPPFAKYLPGVMMSIAIEPRPRWPIVLRNTRALHGAMTSALDVGHNPRFSYFALRQTDLSPSGWAVHWWHEKGAFLAKQSIDGELYGKRTVFKFGPAVHLRAPTIERRGRRRVRLETITPVCFVSNAPTGSYSSPTAENLRGTLSGEWLTRFGLQYIAENDLLRIELIEKHREQETRIDLGGKYGIVSGFEGSFVVETNAVGHWLLEAAARTALGSRGSFGFGQVRVREML